MTHTTDGRHTENRWQEQFMIGGKIHGLLRTHTVVSRNVFRPIKCLKHFFSSSCQHFPNAVWNHFQISSAKTQFAKIGGYQNRLLELFSSTQRTPVARFDCGRTAKPLFHEVETVGLWVWFPSMICLGWWAGTTGPPRTPTNQGCEHLSVMPLLRIMLGLSLYFLFLNTEILSFSFCRQFTSKGSEDYKRKDEYHMNGSIG